MDKEVQEIIEVTGLNFDDLAQFTITVEGLDGISNASKEGRSPKLGSEVDFAFSAKVKGDLDAMKMFSFLLNKISEEKGEDFRKKVEGSITRKEKNLPQSHFLPSFWSRIFLIRILESLFPKMAIIPRFNLACLTI